MTDTPRTEGSFPHAPAPRRRNGLLIASIAAGAVLLVGGAGAAGFALAGNDDPGTAAAGSPAPSTTTSAAATSTPSATNAASSSRTACEKLASLSNALPNDAFTMADLTAIKSVAELAAAADSWSIVSSGQLLLESVQDAELARGQGDEARRIEDVKKYVRSLRKSCALAGYPT